MRLKIKSKCVADTFDRLVLCHRLFAQDKLKNSTDDSGLPQGFMLNDASQFAFVRNLQGDVIAMVNQDGETVVEYSYDPWGKIEYHLNEEIEDEQTAMLITALCPLTYRGYNYDFTTGLYYLQSRYYNPEWGRFLNCDDTNILLATQGETHNANLFAYCNNNPINNADYSGYEAEEIVITVVYGIIALVALERVHDSYADIKDIFPKTPVIEKSGPLTGLFQPSKTVWKFMPDEFSCRYDIRKDVIYIKIKLHLFLNPTVHYCEYDIEIRDNNSWQFILDGKHLGRLYDKYSSKYEIEISALGDVSPHFYIASGVASMLYVGHINSKRKKYIRYQMYKQKDLYANDGMTYLLNSYCTYKIVKVGAKYQKGYYREYDCVKEYNAWAKKQK